MKLIDVLQKMKVGDLKKEISKQNIKGYSKLKKAEIIKLMTDRPDRFKYLLLQNMEQKKELLKDKVKLKEAKEKMKKLTAKKIPAKKAQQAEVIKPKPKREPMIPKIIKTKTGVVTVKPKKLSKEEQQTQEDKLSRKRIKKKLIEYEKTLSDDPATRDKRQFLQLKKIIGLKSTIQKKKRRMIREEDIKLYEKLKKLNFFESIDIDKEEIKPIKPKKEEPKEESKEKEIKPKKEKEPEPKTLKEMEKKETKLDNLIKNVEDTIYGFKSKLTDEQDKQRTKLVNQKIDLQEERILLKKKIVNEKDRLYNEKQKENDKKEEKEKKEGIKKIKKVVEDFIKNPTEELLQDIDNSDYFDELSEELQEKAEKAIEKFLKKDKKKVEPKEEPKPEPKKEPKKDEAKEYIKKILETNKKIKLFNRKNLENQLNEKNIDVSRINQIIDSRIKDEIELFSKTEIISDKDIDVFKKGTGKIKNRMFNIINDLQKLIFNKKTTKPAVDFINFLTNETNKREKLYIAVKIQQSFSKYCNKLDQLEDFIKIIKPNNYKNKLEKIKFLDERCLDLIDIIDDLQDKFNITSKQIKDNELMIF